MKSLSVTIQTKADSSNHSTTIYREEELQEGVKILIIGTPNTGKTCIMSLIIDKLKELGVAEENIDTDALDAPFAVQERMIKEQLESQFLVDQLKNQKFSIYEVHQSRIKNVRLA